MRFGIQRFEMMMGTLGEKRGKSVCIAVMGGRINKNGNRISLIIMNK